jgi:hypothetical protein
MDMDFESTNFNDNLFSGNNNNYSDIIGEGMEDIDEYLNDKNSKFKNLFGQNDD